MPKTYYGYVRVSTVEQGNGASLDEQRAAITAFAARNDLTLTDWFMETSTAAKTGRREFTRMLASLRAGRAAGVIIHKIDRSARNLGDWARIGELVDQGIEVRFAHDDLDIRTRGGRLTADIQAVIAADFIRNNREEVKKGMYGWLKRGYFPFAPPIGYAAAGRHKLKTIDPVKGPLVAQAFALYATGQYSLETLRFALARKGLVRKDGKPLLQTSVSYMLRNPFYTGLIIIKKTGQSFEGVHEPLVSRALFDQVQRVLEGRVFVRPPRHEYRYRRLIRCADCPRTLTAEMQKGRVYYRCHNCPGTSLRDADIDRSIETMLALAFDDGDMGDIRDIVQELSRTDQATEERHAAIVDLELATISDRLSRLTDALVDGAIDKDAFNERKAQLLGERLRLNQRKKGDEAEPFLQRVLRRFELWKTAKDGYSAASDVEKRALLHSLGSNFIAHGKELLFAADFPLPETLKWRSPQMCAPQRGHVRIDNLDNVPRLRKPRYEFEAFLRTLRSDEIMAPP